MLKKLMKVFCIVTFSLTLCSIYAISNIPDSNHEQTSPCNDSDELFTGIATTSIYSGPLLF